jgi:hypothetical protein
MLAVAAGFSFVPTPALWILLAAANLVSFWGAIRWGANPEPGRRRVALLALGAGGATELLAVLWLIWRYHGR